MSDNPARPLCPMCRRGISNANRHVEGRTDDRHLSLPSAAARSFAMNARKPVEKVDVQRTHAEH